MNIMDGAAWPLVLLIVHVDRWRNEGEERIKVTSILGRGESNFLNYILKICYPLTRFSKLYQEFL